MNKGIIAFAVLKFFLIKAVTALIGFNLDFIS